MIDAFKGGAFEDCENEKQGWLKSRGEQQEMFSDSMQICRTNSSKTQRAEIMHLVKEFTPSWQS